MRRNCGVADLRVMKRYFAGSGFVQRFGADKFEVGGEIAKWGVLGDELIGFLKEPEGRIVDGVLR